MSYSNKPVWDPSHQGAFQEVWYLKLNDPIHQRALWLRFTLLTSSNGFHRIAETWAVYFQRKENQDINKLAVKQTFDIQAFSYMNLDGNDLIQIDDCELSDSHTRGRVQSKGHSIQWDLKINLTQAASFDSVPHILACMGVVKNSVITVHEDLNFTGVVSIDGEKQEWVATPGMQGHLTGPKNGHSWVWGHCNSFVDDTGHPISFVFEGISARSRLAGLLPSPKLSAFYFLYQGKEYLFNSLWSALRIKSHHTLTEWDFEAEKGDIAFRGHIESEHRAFAGLTYEDTDGTFLYCANSKLAQMKILVYRKGKLEQTLIARGTAALEVVGRRKNPYVPLLL